MVTGLSLTAIPSPGCLGPLGKRRSFARIFARKTLLNEEGAFDGDVEEARLAYDMDEK